MNLDGACSSDEFLYTKAGKNMNKYEGKVFA